MMWHPGAWGWFPFMPMWIFPIIFIVIAILFFRGRGHSPCDCSKDHKKKGSSAREILDRRYANGEINQEEYLRIKKDLE